jgi:hypothetical protein
MRAFPSCGKPNPSAGNCNSPGGKYYQRFPSLFRDGACQFGLARESIVETDLRRSLKELNLCGYYSVNQIIAR